MASPRTEQVGTASARWPQRRWTISTGIRTLIGFVLRTNRDDVRRPARGTANLEFHTGYDQVDQVGRRIARALQDCGIRAANPAAGFPMEMHRFPDHTWSIPHKRVAVAAGLGPMGIHRNVIHPRFGNFVMLGTVATQARVSAYGTPLDFNPCLECKLCMAPLPHKQVKVIDGGMGSPPAREQQS